MEKINWSEGTTWIALPFVLAVIAAMLWLRIAVIVALWGWFMVPIGVPAVAFWSAFGLMLLMGALRSTAGKSDKTGWKYIGGHILHSAVAYGLGAFAVWMI